MATTASQVAHTPPAHKTTPAHITRATLSRFCSGRATLRKSCKTSRTATTPSMPPRRPSATALQRVHNALFRSSPCGRQPPRRPTCLLRATLWDRSESPRRLDAGETLLLRSGCPGFLRKVFALVSMQLLATVAVCALFMRAAPEHARARAHARTHTHARATGQRATPCRTPPHAHRSWAHASVLGTRASVQNTPEHSHAHTPPNCAP